MGLNLEDIIGNNNSSLLEDKTKKTMNRLMIMIAIVVILIVCVTIKIVVDGINAKKLRFIGEVAKQNSIIEYGIQEYYKGYLEGTYTELFGIPYKDVKQDILRTLDTNGIQYVHDWYYLDWNDIHALLNNRKAAYEDDYISRKGYFVNYKNSQSSQSLENDRSINNFLVFLDGISFKNTNWYESADIAILSKEKVPENKIYIKTAEDMKKLADSRNWGKVFALNADIDMSELTFEWVPVGDSKTPFEGTFDGKGYKIKNFSINDPSGMNIGFFGVIGKNGLVNDLVMIDASVSGGTNVGIIAADCRGKIMNSKVRGSSHAQQDTAGGVVGIFSGTAQNILCDCIVSGGRNIGGFAGVVNAGSITSVFVKKDSRTSSVQCNDINAGGLIGSISNSQPVTINRCYAKASVQALNEYAGGLIGYVGLSSSASTAITNCYANCFVESKNNAGGFIGMVYADSAATHLDIKYSYAYCDVSEKCTPNRGGFLGALRGNNTSFNNNMWVYKANDIDQDGNLLVGVGGKTSHDSSQVAVPLPENYQIAQLAGWELEKGNWRLSNNLNALTSERATLVGEPSALDWDQLYEKE